VEPKCLLPCPPEPASGPCTKRVESSPHPISLRSFLTLFPHLRLGLQRLLRQYDRMTEWRILKNGNGSGRGIFEVKFPARSVLLGQPTSFPDSSIYHLNEDQKVSPLSQCAQQEHKELTHYSTATLRLQLDLCVRGRIGQYASDKPGFSSARRHQKFFLALLDDERPLQTLVPSALQQNTLISLIISKLWSKYNVFSGLKMVSIYYAKLKTARSVLNWLISLSRLLSEKQILAQLVKKFLSLYGNKMFIIIVTRVRHLAAPRYFPWFQWLTGRLFRYHVFDFVRENSDKRLRVRMASQVEGMHFIVTVRMSAISWCESS
jgi:hypothetical protein